MGGIKAPRDYLQRQRKKVLMHMLLLNLGMVLIAAVVFMWFYKH
jgi:NhaP-type Na+/H+ or K+/H+ antiporter